MPRPKKCRRVCDYPQTLTFLPEDHKNREQAVILTVDEYETIRLIDKEGLSQEQCGDFMQVARTTVQQIYAGARKSWRMCWWTAFLCGSKAETISSAAETARAADAPTAINKNSINSTQSQKENTS